MTVSGSPAPLGASPADGGTVFAVCSSRAERLVLCLFDRDGRETSRVDLEPDGDGTWQAFVPGVGRGQRYGFRAYGEYAPQRGLRFNPAKLLMDPYARELCGSFRWSADLYDHARPVSEADRQPYRISSADNAGSVALSVVTEPGTPAGAGPRIPWAETIIYEANVRGYTMRHPDVPEADRGRLAGMKNGKVVDYLRALGITSVELQPVFEFLDEPFLAGSGLRNFWGYNTIGFFVPASRLAAGNARAEFLDMVNAIHEAGLEVILDVAYNHTAESGADGPTLSFRGLDNLAYYRTLPEAPGTYVNDTGTGNTFNADHPFVQRLVLDSLRYWAGSMGVDGFRFDLAPVIGRSADGYDAAHPLLQAITRDPLLRERKLIAEPWDPGPGGYQLGRFPPGWGEWNDRFRDSVRRFWRGDDGEAAEFAKRVHGSSDLFDTPGRGPAASINFVTAHDGFTLLDLVSYSRRHNEANGEKNRDGHAHNFSANYGVEGETDDPAILRLRRRQRLNMLGTLLLSQGTPMLLAGDEMGNSQAGNNNAYAQDNDIGWLDWSDADRDPEFLMAIKSLIELRRDVPLFRQEHFLHGAGVNEYGWHDIQWLSAGAKPLSEDDWVRANCLSLILSATDTADGALPRAALLAMNASDRQARFRLPDAGNRHEWQIRFVSAAGSFQPLSGNRWIVPERSMVCALLVEP